MRVWCPGWRRGRKTKTKTKTTRKRGGGEEEEGSEEEEEEVAEKLGEFSSEIRGRGRRRRKRRGARNTQRKEAAHRCSKLAAGTKQLNNTAFIPP
jgi:hypothetical protein